MKFIINKEELKLETLLIGGSDVSIFVKEGIINAVRESIPVEQILRSYLDETTEEDVEVQEEIIEESKPVEDSNVVKSEVTEILDKDQDVMKLKTNDNLIIKDEAAIKLDIVDTLSNNSSVDSGNSESVITKLQNAPVVPSSPPKSISFNNTDRAVSPTGMEEKIDAPKTVERLERISHEQNEKRKLEEMADDFDDEDRITIGDPIGNDILAKVETISPKSSAAPPLLEGVEILS